MKLETEFRVCLQLMQLEQAFDNATVAHPTELPQQNLPSSTWIKLVCPPTEFCGDEALLLCQSSEREWLAWVPDYGEITLKAGDYTALLI